MKASVTLSAAVDEISSLVHSAELVKCGEWPNLRPIVARELDLLPAIRAKDPSGSCLDTLALLTKLRHSVEKGYLDGNTLDKMIQQEIKGLERKGLESQSKEESVASTEVSQIEYEWPGIPTDLPTNKGQIVLFNAFSISSVIVYAQAAIYVADDAPPLFYTLNSNKSHYNIVGPDGTSAAHWQKLSFATKDVNIAFFEGVRWFISCSSGDKIICIKMCTYGATDGFLRSLGEQTDCEFKPTTAYVNFAFAWFLLVCTDTR